MIVVGSTPFTTPVVHAESSTNISILDNGSPSGFSTTGSWTTIPEKDAFAGSYRQAFGSNASATWTFGNISPGRYRISVTYRPRSYFSKNAMFRVYDAETDLGVTAVNQSVRATSGDDASGTPWQRLGSTDEFIIRSSTIRVQLSGNTTAQVQADAVKIERLGHLRDADILKDFAQSSGIQRSDAGEGESPVQIDALVIFNDRAVSLYNNSTDDLTRWIRTAFDCTAGVDAHCEKYGDITMSINGIMKASGVNARFNIVDMQYYTFGQYQRAIDILETAMASKVIERARAAAHADIVVIFNGNPAVNTSSESLGETMYPQMRTSTIDEISSSAHRWKHQDHIYNAAFATSVITLKEKYDGVMVAAHEIGHLLGAGHEIERNDHTIEPSAHAFTLDGYVKTIDTAIVDYAGYVGTTTGCPSKCTSVPVFSNPNIEVTSKGRVIRLGIPGVKDNVSVMNRMAPIVASYRDRPALNLHNPENCLDVNGDGYVVPLDSLTVINYMSSGEELEQAKMPSVRAVLLGYTFVDVNRDGWISPIDALMIINHMNNPTDPAFAPENVCPR